jgi:hypothetical protein
MNQTPASITEPATSGRDRIRLGWRFGTSGVSQAGVGRIFARLGARVRAACGKERTPVPRYVFATALSLLTGCQSTVFSLPGAPGDPALYASIYPYYIEPCAVSALKKKPGHGFEYRGGPGGHAVVYLNGVCRDPKQDYPTVEICDDTVPSAEAGVGLSSNGHFSNAAWIATPGRDFFFNGSLRPGEGVNTESYGRTQATAKQLGILNGVRFHKEVFDDRPAGMARGDFMCEAAVATDYGVSLGRGRFCARLPVSRTQMERVVAYLNADNAQYRDGQRRFEMTVVGDNCSHFTHNVLAAAGLWDKWPTDRFVLVSALSFPVPKNEFVNQMRRSNDLPIDNPVLLYRDPVAREALLRDDWLPTSPGAIATATPMRQQNALYDTDVGLIFYDIPILGSFHYQFDHIAADRRYTDLADNLQHFAAVYDRISADRRSPGWWLARADLPRADDPSFLAFTKLYYDYIDRMNGRTNLALLALRQATRPVALAAQDPVGSAKPMRLMR